MIYEDTRYIQLIKFYILLKHATGGNALERGTCLYNHFRGQKAVCFYVDLQANDPVGGEETMHNFHLGALLPCPLQVRA